MELEIRDFEVKNLEAEGAHIYLKAKVEINGIQQSIEVFFRDLSQEKKIFNEATMLIEGDLIEADGGTSLLNTQVKSVKLDVELPLDQMSIKDRLYATGLIHEFRKVYRRDKIRAREILKALGLSEEYAEEILLSRKFILPFD